MVLDEKTIAKIKAVIEKHHAGLLVGTLGKKGMTGYQRRKLLEAGISLKDEESVLEAIYHHNYLNEHGKIAAPTNVQEMKAQQSKAKVLPVAATHEASKDYLHSNMKHLIEKQKTNVLSQIEGMIRDTNNQFKFDKLQKLDDLSKDKSIRGLKTQLRDYSRDANRNWDRIVNTEMSNAISLGSVDRIADDNPTKDMDEVYVYRIVKNDAALCKYCRRFYLDSDGSPKLYRMSTLLSNGSNYGQKAADWQPTAMATHPNERCSQVIELKPGFRLLSGGSVTFIGKEAWAEYIQEKVQ